MKINKWTLGSGRPSGWSASRPPHCCTTSGADGNTPLLTVAVGHHHQWLCWHISGLEPRHRHCERRPLCLALRGQTKRVSTPMPEDIKPSKPAEMDGQWAAGYVAELSYGPDATAIDAGAASSIRQAYADLGVPLGNGLELKLGRGDNILGYETSDAMNDPNWPVRRLYSSLLSTLVCWRLIKFADWSRRKAVSWMKSRPSAASMPRESRRGFISLITSPLPDSWGALKGSARTQVDRLSSAQGHPVPGGTGGNMTEWHVNNQYPHQGPNLRRFWDNISDTDVGGSSTPAASMPSPVMCHIR